MPRPLRRADYLESSTKASGIAKLGNRFKTLDATLKKIYDRDTDFSKDVPGDTIDLPTGNDKPSGLTGYRGKWIVSDEDESSQYVRDGVSWTKETLIDQTGLRGISVFHDTLIGVRSGHIQAETGKKPFWSSATIAPKDQEPEFNNPVSYSHLKVGEEKRLPTVEVEYTQTELDLPSSNTWTGMAPLPDGGYAVLDQTARKIIRYNAHGTKTDESATQLPVGCSGLALVGNTLHVGYIDGGYRTIEIANSAGFPEGVTREVQRGATKAVAIAKYGNGWMVYYLTGTAGQFASRGNSPTPQTLIFNYEHIIDFALDSKYLYGIIGNKLVLHNEDLSFDGSITPTGQSYDIGSLFPSGYTFEAMDYDGDFFWFMAKSGSTHRIIKMPKAVIHKITKSNGTIYYGHTTHKYITPVGVRLSTITTQSTLTGVKYLAGIASDGNHVYVSGSNGRTFTINTEGDTTLPLRPIYDTTTCLGLGSNGTNLLVVSAGNKVQEYYNHGLNVNAHPLTNTHATGATVNGTKAYVLDNNSGTCKVFVYNISGTTWTKDSQEITLTGITTADGITNDGRNLFIVDDTKIYQWGFNGTKGSIEITLDDLPSNYHGVDIAYQDDRLYVLYGYYPGNHNSLTHHVKSITISHTTKNAAPPITRSTLNKPSGTNTVVFTGLTHDNNKLYTINSGAPRDIYSFGVTGGTVSPETPSISSTLSSPQAVGSESIGQGEGIITGIAKDSDSFIITRYGDSLSPPKTLAYLFNSSNHNHRTGRNSPLVMGGVQAVTGIYYNDIDQKYYGIDNQSKKIQVYANQAGLVNTPTTLATLTTNKTYTSICGDGTHLWILNSTDKILECVKISDGSRVESQDISLPPIDGQGTNPPANYAYLGSTIVGNNLYCIADRYVANTNNPAYLYKVGISKPNVPDPGLQFQTIGNNGTNLAIGTFPNKLEVYSGYTWNSTISMQIATMLSIRGIVFHTQYDILYESTDDKFHIQPINKNGTLIGSLTPVITALSGKDPVGLGYDEVSYYVLSNADNKVYYFDENFALEGNFDVAARTYVGMTSYNDVLYLLTSTGEILLYDTVGRNYPISNLLLSPQAGEKYVGITQLGDHLYVLLTKDGDINSWIKQLPATRSPQRFGRSNIEAVTNDGTRYTKLNLNCMAVTNSHFYFGDTTSSLVWQFDRNDPTEEGKIFQIQTAPNSYLRVAGQLDISAASNSDNSNIYSLEDDPVIHTLVYQGGRATSAPVLVDLGRRPPLTTSATLRAMYYHSQNGKFYVTNSTNFAVVDTKLNPTPVTLKGFNVLSEDPTWKHIFYTEGHVYLCDSGDALFYAFNETTGQYVPTKNIDLRPIVGSSIDASAFNGETLYVAVEGTTDIVVYPFDIAKRYLGEPDIVINKVAADNKEGFGSSMGGLAVDNDKIYAGFVVQNHIASFNLDGTNRTTEVANDGVFHFDRDGRWTYGLYFDTSLTTTLKIFYDGTKVGNDISLTGFTGNVRNQNYGVGIVRLGNEFVILASNKISKYTLKGVKVADSEIDNGIGTGFNYIDGLAIGANRIYAAVGGTHTIHYWDFDLKHLGSFSVDVPLYDMYGLGYYRDKLYLLLNNPDQHDHFTVKPITVTEIDNPTGTLTIPNITETLVGCAYGDHIYITTHAVDSRGNDVMWLYQYMPDGTFISKTSPGIFNHDTFHLGYFYNVGEGNFVVGHEGNNKIVAMYIPYQSPKIVTLTGIDSGDKFQGTAVVGNVIYALSQNKIYSTGRVPLFTRTLQAGKHNLPITREWAGMASDGKLLYLCEKAAKDEITKIYVVDPIKRVSTTTAEDNLVRLEEITIGKLGKDIIDLMYKDGSLYFMYAGTNQAEFFEFPIDKYKSDYDIDYGTKQLQLATNGQYHFTHHENKLTRVGKHTLNTKDLVELPDTHVDITTTVPRKRLINLNFTNLNGKVNSMGNRDGKLYVFSSTGQAFEVDPTTTTQTLTSTGGPGVSPTAGATWDGERWVVAHDEEGNEHLRVFDESWQQDTSKQTTLGFQNPKGITFLNNRYYIFAEDNTGHNTLYVYGKSLNEIRGAEVRFTAVDEAPSGMATDGTYLYVITERASSNAAANLAVYRYDANLKNPVKIVLSAFVYRWRQGMTFMGNTLYILNEEENKPDKIYAYDLLTGAERLSGVEFKGSDITTLEGSKLVNYNIEGKKDAEVEITGLDEPKGITKMGNKWFVIDGNNINHIANNKVARNYNPNPYRSEFAYNPTNTANLITGAAFIDEKLYMLEKDAQGRGYLVSFVPDGSNKTQTTSGVDRATLSGASNLEEPITTHNGKILVAKLDAGKLQYYNTDGTLDGTEITVTGLSLPVNGLDIHDGKLYILRDHNPNATIHICPVPSAGQTIAITDTIPVTGHENSALAVDGEYAWVLKYNAAKMEGYDLATKDKVLEFPLGAVRNEQYYQGATIKDNVMWISSGDGGKNATVQSYPFYTLDMALNLTGNIVDITNDGSYLYVARGSTKTIHAYDEHRRRPERDVQLHTTLDVAGIAYADNLLHVTTSDGHVFHYTITTTNAPGASNAMTLPTFTPTGVAVHGDNILVLDNTNDKMKGYIGRGSSMGAYTDLDYDFRNDTPNTPDAIQGMDVDGYTAYVINRADSDSLWHKVYLYDIRPQLIKNLVSKFNILQAVARAITKPLISKFTISKFTQFKGLISKFVVGNVIHDELKSKFNIQIFTLPKELISKFNVLSHTLPKELISKFNIQALEIEKPLVSKFTILSDLVVKPLISKFEIAAIIITEEINSFFYVLNTNRRLASFDIVLPTAIKRPTGITRMGKYFYVANDDNVAAIQNDDKIFAIDSVTKQNVPSRAISLVKDNANTYFDNNQPAGVAYYNNILYCLENDGGFDQRLFRYNPNTNDNIAGQLELYSVDRYELDGGTGVTIDKNGTMYVVAPNNYDRRSRPPTHQPRIMVYGPPPTTGFGGIRNIVRIYPTTEIVINGTETGIAVNDEFVVTIGTDYVVRFYDKNDNYALVENRQFTLPSDVLQLPTGCHLDGDILWVTDRKAPDETIHAFNIGLVSLETSFVSKFVIRAWTLPKHLIAKFNIGIYTLPKELISKFVINTHLRTKHLAVRFDIKSFLHPKQLISKFVIGTATTKELKSKFNILSHILHPELISKFVIGTHHITKPLISKFTIGKTITKKLITKFVISRHRSTKELVTKFRIFNVRTVVAPFITKFSIGRYTITKELIAKFTLQSELILVRLRSKFKIDVAGTYQLIRFKNQETEYIKFNNR